MIGFMNTIRARAVAVASLLTVLSTVAYGQVDSTKLSPSIPRYQEDPSYAIAWGIAIVFVVGVLAIAFKSGKRGHHE